MKLQEAIKERSNVKKTGTAVLSSLMFCIVLPMFFVPVANAVEDSWQSKALMPLNSWGIVGVNGKIYAFGGSGEYYNVTYSNNAVLEYDPVLDIWTVKGVMPIKRSDFVLAAYQNKIYVMGGEGGLNQVYDPQIGTWENRTSVPTPRIQLEANVVDGKIYLIGGRTGGQKSTVALNEVYDPQTDTWTTKEPMQYPVVEYASAVVDNKIYVIGGQDEFHKELNLDVTQIYDTTTDKWSLGAPLPKVVWQATAGATTDEQAPKRIYVLGGLPEKSLFGTDWNQVYDTQTNTWTDGEPMPTARFSLGVAVLNDKLYVMRGEPYFNLNGVYCSENEQYTPVDYIPSGTVYIKADGSVEGTKKIQRNENVYTLTDNIYNSTISVLKDDVVLDGAGFTVRGAPSGIVLLDRNNVTIKNFVISTNYSSDNIELYYCSNCTILNNTITPFIETFAGPGIAVWGGASNVIAENRVMNTPCGIVLLEGTHNNSIVRNNITDNTAGMRIHGSQNNNIYHNNFINNNHDIWIIGGPPETTLVNHFDNGTTGNYWNNYNGTDKDGDGIGDAPYVIDENNQDKYPLMEQAASPAFPLWQVLVAGFFVIIALLIVYKYWFSKERKDEP
jgi:parallel beta-helix repeat protein